MFLAWLCLGFSFDDVVLFLSDKANDFLWELIKCFESRILSQFVGLIKRYSSNSSKSKILALHFWMHYSEVGTLSVTSR